MRQLGLLQRSIFSMGHGTTPQEQLPAPGHRSKSSTSCAAAASADDFFPSRPSRTCFKRPSSFSTSLRLSTASPRISMIVADPPEFVFDRDWSRLRFLTSSGFGTSNSGTKQGSSSNFSRRSISASCAAACAISASIFACMAGRRMPGGVATTSPTRRRFGSVSAAFGVEGSAVDADGRSRSTKCDRSICSAAMPHPTMPTFRVVLRVVGDERTLEPHHADLLVGGVQ